MTAAEQGAVTFDNLFTALIQADCWKQRRPRIVELIDEWLAHYADDAASNSNTDGDRMFAAVFRIVREHITKE